MSRWLGTYQASSALVALAVQLNYYTSTQVIKVTTVLVSLVEVDVDHHLSQPLLFFNVLLNILLCPDEV